MARGIRFTKAERDFIRQRIDLSLNPKIAARIAAKLDESERVSLGVSVVEAVLEFRKVLGGRLIEPPQGARGVYAQMHKRLDSLGLTLAQCREAAEAARDRWQGAVKAESIVRQADALLAPYEPVAGSARGFERAVPME